MRDRSGQDRSLFLSRGFFGRVEAATGRHFRNEEFRDLADLAEAHPGVFRHRFEAHPVKAIIVSATLAVLVLVVSIIVAHAH